jgi:hypothetical protein
VHRVVLIEKRYYRITISRSTLLRGERRVTGLISIAFGVVLSARRDIGAVPLAPLFGLFSKGLRRVGDRGGRAAAPDRADSQAVLHDAARTAQGAAPAARLAGAR